jgi:DNA mismatch endonuclease (patch repair protein)
MTRQAMAEPRDESMTPIPKMLPAPPPSSPAARTVMQANRSRDSGLEITLRKALHAEGFRFRKHRRPIPAVRCEPDVVFPREKVVVFVDGCWWHGCPEHWQPPVANREFWIRKVEVNAARDRRNDDALVAAGWLVVRAWEHEEIADVTARVAEAVVNRRQQFDG